MQGDLETILIIDDDPTLRAMCKSALEQKGYRVLEAQNGSAADKVFKSQKIDIVFLDILMPDKDGLETLLDIRRNNPSIYVYAMSGGGRKGNFGYLDIARRFGADEVVKKPFLPSTLIELIQSRTAPQDRASHSA